MDTVAEWINASLKNIDHEMFRDVVKVDLKLTPMGDGQVVVISEIKRALLTLVTSRGQKKHLKVIVKTEPTSEGAQAMVRMADVFATETMMYRDTLKDMEKLMSENNISFLWAECYFCGNNKFVFQDLCESGYKVVPTYNFLDYNHTALVMKSIGQFHGLSLVMKERNTLDVNKFKPCFYSQRVPFLINIIKMSVQNLVRNMKTNWGPEWKTAAEKLENYASNPGESLYNMCESVKDKWCVLNHGDFSMRNMLFHYTDGSTTPDFLKFVDFQGCHFSNFAFDLSSFLYSSVKPKLRQDNLSKFLQIYLESLQLTCSSYGYKGVLPTINDVHSSLKELNFLTTMVSILNIPFFIASKHEGVQEEAESWFEKLSTEEVSGDVLDGQNDITLNDAEVTNEMKFEIQRMLDEKIF